MSARILVVDDEKAIADTLCIILSAAGYECATAYGGPEALRIATQWKPDLCITDVVMPTMTGIELALQLRPVLPHCAILLFSGNAATQELMEKSELDAHSVEVCAKPIPPRQLLRKIRDLLRQQRHK